VSQLSVMDRARQMAGIKSLATIPGRLPSRARKTLDAPLSNRLTADWQPIERLSADAELQGRLHILRSRSRDHERNDPYAEGFYKLRENNVVGHDGFTLQMKVVLSESEDPQTGEMVSVLDKKANRAIERGWKLFCEPENFLVTRDMHAIEACKLVERTIQRDGDLLIRKIKGAPNIFGFALQLLEPDYLDDQFIEFRGAPCNCPIERQLPDGRPFPRCQAGWHEVRMGVELHGDWKFPVAYWLLANHPGDYFWGTQSSVRRIRVPVEEIIHPFIHKRPGQTRGIPAMVAAMMRLQMIGGMDEAALVAARVGAQKMGIITKDVPEDFPAGEDGEGNSTGFDPDALNGRTIDGAPGEFLELPMGFDIKSIDWKNPDNAYEPFQTKQLRGVAAGAGVSYSSLAQDPSDANFSATRIGMLEEREGYRGGQGFFIRKILKQIFPDFLEAAMLTSVVDLPFSRFDAYTDVEAVCFHGRGFPWIDPQKDIQAAKDAIDLGVDTRSRIAGENAGDFEEITAELGREKELRTAAGLVDVPPALPGRPAGDPAKPEAAKPAPEEVKSAFMGDMPLSSLPAETQACVRDFAPGAPDNANVIRYGMTVPELLTKVDQHNYATAKKHLRRITVDEAAAIVRGRPDKHVLLVNDRIIDGHHHLARAEKGKISRSLPVLDLTPLRFTPPTVKA